MAPRLLPVALFRNYCHYNKCQIPSLFATRYCSFPIVVRRQLSRASLFNTIVICGHHRPRKSPAAVIISNPLSPSSLVAVSRHRSLSSAATVLPIIVRCRRSCRFLSAVDIITIYCPPSPHLLSPAPLLVSCRASSPPPSPASTLTSGEIGQRRMGGGVR